MKTRVRARGALYGLAIGDALGMPTQMLSRPQIVARWGTLLAGFEPAPPGHPIAAGLCGTRRIITRSNHSAHFCKLLPKPRTLTCSTSCAVRECHTGMGWTTPCKSRGPSSRYWRIRSSQSSGS